MEMRGTRNGPSGENDSMMRVVQGMMQSQQQHAELLCQGLWLHPD